MLHWEGCLISCPVPGAPKTCILDAIKQLLVQKSSSSPSLFLCGIMLDMTAEVPHREHSCGVWIFCKNINNKDFKKSFKLLFPLTKYIVMLQFVFLHSYTKFMFQTPPISHLAEVRQTLGAAESFVSVLHLEHERCLAAGLAVLTDRQAVDVAETMQARDAADLMDDFLMYDLMFALRREEHQPAPK